MAIDSSDLVSEGPGAASDTKPADATTPVTPTSFVSPTAAGNPQRAESPEKHAVPNGRTKRRVLPAAPAPQGKAKRSMYCCHCCAPSSL